MIKRFENYTVEELADACIVFGNNVTISRDVIFHNSHHIFLGNNVRIDTQCILIAGHGHIINIGNNVHISAGCYYYGNSGDIVLEDFTCTSAKCLLYTANDDYVDGYMTNSTVDEKFKKLETGDIVLRRHVVVGCHSIILPGVTLEYATSVGANSLVNRSSEPFDVIGGTPAKFIKKRKNIFLNI